MLAEQPLQPEEKNEMTDLLRKGFFYGRDFTDDLGGGNAVGAVFVTIAEAISEATTIAELEVAMAKKAAEIKAAAEADKFKVDAEMIAVLADSLSETCRKTFCRMRGLKESDVFGEEDEHNAEIIPLFGEGRRPTIH